MVEDDNNRWIKSLLKEENYESHYKLVANFLISWSFFEIKIFNNFNFKNNKSDIDFDEKKLNGEFNFFKQRYRDDEKVEKLINRDRNGNDFKNLNKKELCELGYEEKIKYLMFIVFRFRCNMFHGNKNPFNWSRYKEPIEHCISVMRIIYNNYEKN